MTDTNLLSQLAQAAPVAQNALDAWHVVALGAGAYLAHAYHSIKAAGGIKNILRGLWDGGANSNAEGRMQKEETGDENPDARKSYIVNRQSPPPHADQEISAPIPSPDTRHSSPL